MLNITQVTAILKERKKHCSEPLKRWRDVYYHTSLHIKGACPEYKLYGNTYRPLGYMGKEYQAIFDNELFARHQRESEVTRQWRYSQYKPFQKNAFLRLISICAGAIFQDNNYSIELKNPKDNEYIWGSNIDGSDIIRFYEKHVKSILEDPNGLFVRIPKQAYNATTTTEIHPDIWFVNSKDIIYYVGQDLLFDKGGYVWHITDQAIFRYREISSGNGKKWELADDGGYYAHQFGYLPVDVAGGNWNTEGYYESWIVGALALADELVGSKSSEQLVDKESSHPWIQEAVTDCEVCDGSGKEQVECDVSVNPDGFILSRCSACNGSKIKSNNPGERLLVPADQMKDDLIRVITPPIEVNKNHREKNNEIMMALLDALNLLKVDAAQSGIAKTLDQEAFHQFLSKFTNDLFDRHIYNSCRDVSAYRNVTVVGTSVRPAILKFTIIKPSQFHIKTANDLLAEYEGGVKAGLPLYVRTQAGLEYVEKQYSGDKAMIKKSKVISAIDYLSAATQEEKSLMAANGSARQEDLIFSARLPLILDNLIIEKSSDWFIKSDIPAIKVEAMAAFDKLVPPPPVIVPNKKDAKQTGPDI